PAELRRLTEIVAENNGWRAPRPDPSSQHLFSGLRDRIHHVIYVVKENRTYDQLLGNLGKGNGDPSLAILAPYSPNHQKIAREFVLLDNFFDSGEVSGDGWQWSTAARTTETTEKTVPLHYAHRGPTYDWEGSNRNVPVGLPSEERREANPLLPRDPNLLPGPADAAAPDGGSGEAGAGFLWDAALRRGLSVRNYGFFGDLTRYFLPPALPGGVALARLPFSAHRRQFYPVQQRLIPLSDPFYRGFDMRYPDYWRFREWQREFEAFCRNSSLPTLELVRLPHDHFGSFGKAIDGVNTVETQMADNDYALGLLVETVAKSRYRNDTLILVLEDDAQDGVDHVDAHRSVAFVIGPYVRKRGVVSSRFTTVSLLRTLEELLGLPPLGLFDAAARPMEEVFSLTEAQWDYQAVVPAVLRTTSLPLPGSVPVAGASRGRRSAAYWQRAMAGERFEREDRLHPERFNRALWTGLQGEGVPYPAAGRREGVEP
ncbi:partial phospholipase C, partial [Methylacidimicrobium cyclopophantes]